MKISVLTVFPEFYEVLKCSIIGKAMEKNLFEFEVVNVRDFSNDKHKKTDDYPFGGGAGMVMTPQPLHDAIQAVDPERKALRIYLTPKGETLKQSRVKSLSKLEHIVLVNGSYEGIDQRVIDLDIDLELSIGDYVLTSGDYASLIVIDSVLRYVDGVLGSNESAEDESFSDGLLEYPQYTRPQVFEGLAVPEVLVSGHHQKVEEWRRQKSLELTRARRPDLLKED